MKTRVFLALCALPTFLYAVNTDVKSSTGTLETVTKPTKDSPDNQGPTSPNRVLPGERPYARIILFRPLRFRASWFS